MDRLIRPTRHSFRGVHKQGDWCSRRGWEDVGREGGGTTEETEGIWGWNHKVSDHGYQKQTENHCTNNWSNVKIIYLPEMTCTQGFDSVRGEEPGGDATLARPTPAGTSPHHRVQQRRLHRQSGKRLQKNWKGFILMDSALKWWRDAIT